MEMLERGIKYLASEVDSQPIENNFSSFPRQLVKTEVVIIFIILGNI
jgi:hypothetical protein